VSEKKHWIYGHHAVLGAINNDGRKVYRVVCLKGVLLPADLDIKIQTVEKDFFSKQFGPMAVHQGIAAEVSSLVNYTIEDILASDSLGPVVILDQLTDPHNVGAIIRSAAAFGAMAVLTTEKNSPPINNPALVKAASGAVEIIPYVQVTNLTRAIELLKEDGYWIMGLDERGSVSLDQAPLEGLVAFVLGAEGDGLRRLTKEKCDFLFHIETADEFSTLNVSNATAVSLYAWKTKQTKIINGDIK
jgi:23S rRNA (guanosine2251-2'-O)-methyltransferase